MEFDQTTTAIGFVLILVVLLGGTFSSPMSSTTKMMVGGGQLVFLVLTLALGVKHGEFRASA